MLRIALILALAAQLPACTTTPDPIQIDTSINAYGVPEPKVNGDVVPFTIDENRKIIQGIVNLYCPANATSI